MRERGGKAEFTRAGRIIPAREREQEREREIDREEFAARMECFTYRMGTGEAREADYSERTPVMRSDRVTAESPGNPNMT